MVRFLTVATLGLILVSGAAMADTRGDFMNNSDAYGVITYNKGLPNGHMVSFDIPVHASLLGNKGAMPVAGQGRILATPIGYYTATPIAGHTQVLGLASSPYLHK